MVYSEEVEKLVQQGAKFLGEKNFEGAVETFGEACDLNQEKTGEIDPGLFLLYGKSLYENGVSKSDILGGQEIEEGEKEAEGEEEESGNYQFNALAEEGDEEEEGENEEEEEEEEEDQEKDQDDDDDDDDAKDQEEEKDQENPQENDDSDDKSDLELSWDILEVARNLFEDQLEAKKDIASSLTKPYLKSDKEQPSNEYVTILKQLSETYDLLGEVSLESEHFPQAANDLQRCLDMRLELYDGKVSSLVGESHFKLSLALEFCIEDETSKDKARDHIKAAIDILKTDSERNPEKAKDNDDIIQSLQVRYDEIESGAEALIEQQKQDMLQGILGNATSGGNLGDALSGLVSGGSAPEPAPTKPSTSSNVNDLTSMVKKRKAKPSSKSEKRSKK